MTKNIRVLVADDHAVVREGLRALIGTARGMELVGEAADGFEAVGKARTLQPDVIVLDLVMPGMSGLEAIIQIKRENPAARVLVLTSFAQDDMVFPAIKTGALGYLLKDSMPHELLQAIRNVDQGESSLHPTIARKLIRELADPSDLHPVAAVLTGREMEVLKLVAKGLSNQQIGDRLFISGRTVGSHVGNILGKLHLTSRVEAALYALQEGLVSSPQQSNPPTTP